MTRKLFRGTSIKECMNYKKKEIPKGKEFTNRLVGARNKGVCVVQANFNKKIFEPNRKQNRTFKELKISERYYKNKKPIKKFKIKIHDTT